MTNWNPKDWKQQQWKSDIATYERMKEWLHIFHYSPKMVDYANKRMEEIKAKWPNQRKAFE